MVTERIKIDDRVSILKVTEDIRPLYINMNGIYIILPTKHKYYEIGILYGVLSKVKYKRRERLIELLSIYI